MEILKRDKICLRGRAGQQFVYLRFRSGYSRKHIAICPLAVQCFLPCLRIQQNYTHSFTDRVKRQNMQDLQQYIIFLFSCGLFRMHNIAPGPGCLQFKYLTMKILCNSILNRLFEHTNYISSIDVWNAKIIFHIHIFIQLQSMRYYK